MQSAVTMLAKQSMLGIHDVHFSSRTSKELRVKLIAARNQSKIKTFVRNGHEHSCWRHCTDSIMAVGEHAPDACEAQSCE